jgi:Trk-type K+ transport system membrane component
VRAAQPLFLALVSIGSIVTSSTILPMSMEETTVAYGEHGLDMACMAAPWLYFLGMNIAFSALFAKTVSVHQARIRQRVRCRCLIGSHVFFCLHTCFFPFFLVTT